MMSLAFIPMLFVAGGAAQPAQQPQRAPAFEALVRCRAVAGAEERLRCFDAAAEALDRAEAARDLVVVDRGQVRESRRRLFGLAVPDLPIFGRRTERDEEAEEVRSIEGLVRSARQNALGQWVVTLEDGAIWVQADDNVIALRPVAGQRVQINRAALGTFMMRINNQPGVRARRQM